MDAHRLAEERSLALHAVIAERIAADGSIVDRARARVEEWLQNGSVHRDYAEAWLALLAQPREELSRALVDASERARALRQVIPFSFVIPPRERWKIWREVRERSEREGRFLP